MKGDVCKKLQKKEIVKISEILLKYKKERKK